MQNTAIAVPVQFLHRLADALDAVARSANDTAHHATRAASDVRKLIDRPEPFPVPVPVPVPADKPARKRTRSRSGVNWDHVPLGAVSDTALAQQLGVSQPTVRAQRIKRNIPTFKRSV